MLELFKGVKDVPNFLFSLKVHVLMAGYVIHIPALGEQSVDFTEIGISDNF